MTEGRRPDQHPVRRWAEALRRRDNAAMAALLADDVVLHSPLTDAFVFEGRRAVAEVFAAGSSLIDAIEVHTVLADADRGVVVFAGRIDGRPMEETQVLRLADGRVVDVTLMGRPVPALLSVMSRIPARLAKASVLPRAAGPLGAGFTPIAALVSAIDRHLLPRTPPRRL